MESKIAQIKVESIKELTPQIWEVSDDVGMLYRMDDWLSAQVLKPGVEVCAQVWIGTGGYRRIDRLCRFVTMPKPLPLLPQYPTNQIRWDDISRLIESRYMVHLLDFNIQVESCADALFPLGEVYTSKTTVETLNRYGIKIQELLWRHQCGDWGHVSAAIVLLNSSVLQDQTRGTIIADAEIGGPISADQIFSEYKLKDLGILATSPDLVILADRIEVATNLDFSLTIVDIHISMGYA